MLNIAASFALSMLMAVPLVEAAQSRTPSPASVDSAGVEFFLEDDIDVEQSWTYSTDVDEFTDEVMHRAAVFASRGDGVIYVVCHDGVIGVAASTGVWLDIEEDLRDEKPVRYRVDKYRAVNTRWPGKDLHSFVLEPRSLVFARALLKGRSHVLLELTSWDGNSRRARFPLQGARQAIGQVFGACGKTQ